jgi:outer membrane lipoprotein SlyB
MQKGVFLLCVLGISCVSVAQTNHAPWTNLNGLKPGQKIQIVEMNSKKHSGAFESVSDSAISLRDAKGEEAVQKQDVRSVKLMKNRYRLRNTLIGAGVGAGAGAGIGAASWSSDGWFGGKRVGALVGAVYGIVGGSIVGALVPTRDTIYSAGSH